MSTSATRKQRSILRLNRSRAGLRSSDSALTSARFLAKANPRSTKRRARSVRYCRNQVVFACRYRQHLPRYEFGASDHERLTQMMAGQTRAFLRSMKRKNAPISPLGALEPCGRRDRLRVQRSDVLVHAEEVRWVVLGFQGDKAIIVAAISGLKPAVVPIVHHEVHIAAVSRVRMHGLPVSLGPARNLARLLRIGVDAGDDHRPCRVARVPSGFALADATDSAVDRIKMHERERARQFLCLGDMG